VALRGRKARRACFNAEDERLLTIIGAQVGRVYENGSLYREVQEQATQLMVEVEERERVVVQLRASEELFRQLAENIQDVFFVSSPDLVQIFYISPGFERIWGMQPDSWVASEANRLAAVFPDDRERVGAQLRQIVRSYPAAGQLEFRILHPDGSTHWVLSRFFPILDDSGKVVRTVGVTADITERKLAELRIVRLNRTYSVLSGINSLIVRATDRDALLTDACRLAVEHGGFRVAWCGLLDQATNTLRPAPSRAMPTIWLLPSS